MTRRIAVPLMLLFLLALQVNAQESSWEKNWFKYQSKKYEYLISTPAQFDTANTYPAVIFGSEQYRIHHPENYGWIGVRFPIDTYNSNVFQRLMRRLKDSLHIENDKFHLIVESDDCFEAYANVISNAIYVNSLITFEGKPNTSSQEILGSLEEVKILNLIRAERKPEFNELESLLRLVEINYQTGPLTSNGSISEQDLMDYLNSFR